MSKKDYESKHEYYRLYEKELNKRQKKMFSYIVEYAKQNYGKTPSYSELAKAVGTRSKGTVFKDIKQLEHHGYIRRYKVESNLKQTNYEIVTDKELSELKDPFLEDDGIESYKNAKIPYIGRINNSKDVLSKENYKEYISVPIETGKQTFMYAFRCPHGRYKKDGMLFSSTIIFDTKAKYIHMDYVAYYNARTNRLDVMKYDRNLEKEEKEKIVGKIVGSYTEITF